jgi:type IV pilus assembly protein PilW
MTHCYRMYIKSASCQLAWVRQAGLTLVELMVAMTLGLLVVLAATGLLVSSKNSYTAQDDNIRVQDAGRFALEIITRAVRQTGYVNWDKQDAPMIATDVMSPSIVGLDANSLKSSAIGIENPLGTSVNGSDVLAVRFFGVGNKPSAGSSVDGFSRDGYGSIINCAGFGVDAPVSQNTADEDRGWSIFYVANNSNGEPELRCKYYGGSWSSEAIASGVESFQVLYGVDSDSPPDSLPNKFLTATEINALDDKDGLSALPLADKNKLTNWKKVVAIKIGLLLRGASPNGGSAAVCPDAICFDLFGTDYGKDNSAADKGTRFKESDLPANTQNRVRKVFATTIQLRNSAS